MSRKANEVSPLIVIVSSLERVSRLLPRLGNQKRVWWSHRVEEAEIEVWEEQGG